MAEHFRFIRFAVVWLVILMIGRFILGATGVPYETGTVIFSMVIFTAISALYFGAFSRRVKSYKWHQGMLLGTMIGLTAQILILLATVVSYLVGADTYFNNPTALNVEEAIGLGQALPIRLGGLVVNTIIASIVALIGWSTGKLIPE